MQPRRPERPASAALAQHYSYLSRYGREAILLVDEQHRVRDANERSLELYGYPREKMLSLTIEDLRAPAALSNLREQWDAAGGNDGALFETVHRRSDGSTFPVEVSSRIIEIEGTIFRQSIIRDVTERCQAERRLRESEARLKLALEAANEGLWDWETGHSETYFSPRYYTMLGYQQGELPPTYETFENLVHPEDLARVRRELDEYLQSDGGDLALEFRMRTRAGDYLWILSRGRTVERDEDGRPLRLVGTHSDITDRKHLEDQFRQAHKMEAVGRLAGGIAHDFNNLLTVITGYSDLALDSLPEEDPLFEPMVEIKEAAERASTLTQQLLAFSRRQILQPRILNLNSVVVHIRNLVGRLLGEDILFNTHLDPQLGNVRADAGQLHQVLMNLAVNARDAMPNGGSLTMETGNAELDRSSMQRDLDVQPGPYVMLAVTDTGCGMDQNTLAHLFEPFFTTKEQGKGTGLGLSTVYGIVKQSGGCIWVYSEPGRGSTFKLFFPRVDAPAAEGEAREAERDTGLRTETVLLVEDDKQVRDLAFLVLEKQGYVVLDSTSGEEALQIARHYQGAIDLLLTDVIMPEMGGCELATRLAELRPEVKVLYMSGFTESVIVQQGELQPGMAFIPKPFTPERLSAKVREVLRSS